MAIAPTVRGLILCQEADIDPVTRNLSMLQCFRALKADRFPSATKRFYVMAHLVNGLGDVTLRVDIVQLSDNRSLYRFPMAVHFQDRLQEMRMKVEVGQFVAPSRGKYGIKLWANDDLIAMTDFSVIGGKP